MLLSMAMPGCNSVRGCNYGGMRRNGYSQYIRGEARMWHQEHKPAAWMPTARDRETWTLNDPRPHESEAGYY